MNSLRPNHITGGILNPTIQNLETLKSGFLEDVVCKWLGFSHSYGPNPLKTEPLKICTKYSS